MTALLPEGRFVPEPDSTKLVKVVPSPGGHIVIVKLDDDTEMMIKTCPDAESAHAFADRCTNALNGDDDPPSEEDEPSKSVRPIEGQNDNSGPSSSQTTPSKQSSSSAGSASSSSKGSGLSSRTSVGLSSGQQGSPTSNTQISGSNSTTPTPTSVSMNQGSSNDEAIPPSEDEPTSFPAFGSALEDSLEDSDEWPFDNGQDDWFD